MTRKYLKWNDIEHIFSKYNRKSGMKNGAKTFNAYVMYQQANFTKTYKEISRTYTFTNDNKAFQDGMGGYSIFASCMDGKSDPCLRIENVGWDIEKCWMYKEDYDEIIGLTEE